MTPTEKQRKEQPEREARKAIDRAMDTITETAPWLTRTEILEMMAAAIRVQHDKDVDARMREIFHKEVT